MNSTQIIEYNQKFLRFMPDDKQIQEAVNTMAEIEINSVLLIAIKTNNLGIFHAKRDQHNKAIECYDVAAAIDKTNEVSKALEDYSTFLLLNKYNDESNQHIQKMLLGLSQTTLQNFIRMDLLVFIQNLSLAYQISILTICLDENKPLGQFFKPTEKSLLNSMSLFANNQEINWIYIGNYLETIDPSFMAPHKITFRDDTDRKDNYPLMAEYPSNEKDSFFRL